LGSIACPVLVISGGEDGFFNARRTLQRSKKLLPGAEIHVLPKGKHGITNQGGRIREFLEGR
jgi:pimeloyl-ACP methyl ester carboxylesterase